MEDSPRGRCRRWLVLALRLFVVRLGLFVGAVLVAHQVPEGLKGFVWVLAFLLGAWAFAAFVRESRSVADFLVPRLVDYWRGLGLWMARRRDWWNRLALVCCLILAAIAVFRAWPAWYFLATSSLREDEILNIERYTSRGFAPAVGTYNLARNHILFNVISSLVPGADSTWPLRGRLVSFVSVLGALMVLVAYAARRGWVLAGVACAGFVAVNFYTLKVLLEGRGYGLIGFFATIGCVAFAEWLRTQRQPWLNAVAVTCVLGTYTLPYYVVFGGALLLVAFAHRPSRDTLLAGLLSAAAIGMLYLPVINKVFEVASSYDDEYGDTLTNNFSSIDAVFRTLQNFLSYEVIHIGLLFLIVGTILTLFFLMFARFAKVSDRQAVAGVVLGVLGMLAFFFVLKTVPIRVSAFLVGPMAFLALVMAGSVLKAKFLGPVRPLLLLGFTALTGLVLWNSKITEPLIPRQNWNELSLLIERAFPQKTDVWVSGRYAKLLQPHLDAKRIFEGELNPANLTDGGVIAAEVFFKNGDEKKRLSWEKLPTGVRYVTAPLLVNYQRLFFVPPEVRGVVGVTVNGRTLPMFSASRQPRDPVTLSASGGHGDVLYKDGMTTEVASPGGIPLPAVLEVELASNAAPGVCNLLFSQFLGDKNVRVEVQSAGGNWQKATDVFVFGEMVSIPLSTQGCRVVKVVIEPNPAFVVGSRSQGPRPEFFLVDAWTAML